MDSFFIITGITLFMAGLACLLLVFVAITRRLQTNRQVVQSFRARRSYKEWLLTLIGLILIIVAQGCFWFNGEVGRFVAFEDGVPKMQISFLYEEYRTPRMILQATDQNHQLSSLIIPFNSDEVTIGVEVVKWKKFLKVLGVKDCYRVNGLYYKNDEPSPLSPVDRLPDHNLNGGPSALLSVSAALGNAFPAEMDILFSPVIETGEKNQYSIEISPDLISSNLVREIKISELTPADSSNQK